MTTIVVAKFREHMDWMGRLPDGFSAIVYDKDKGDLLNSVTGLEAHTYLHHIVAHYEHLEGDYIFCQGNPFHDCPNFLDRIKDPSIRWFGSPETCDRFGKPQCVGYAIDLHWWCALCNITPPEGNFAWSTQANFRASAEVIRSRPIGFYEALFRRMDNAVAASALERLWPLIMNYSVSA